MRIYFVPHSKQTAYPLQTYLMMLVKETISVDCGNYSKILNELWEKCRSGDVRAANTSYYDCVLEGSPHMLQGQLTLALLVTLTTNLKISFSCSFSPVPTRGKSTDLRILHYSLAF